MDNSNFLCLFLGLLLFCGEAICQNLAKCHNNGTPLNSTDCLCPGFVSGRLCETTKCQNFGIRDENRCSCPPGLYGAYCELRGCRPPNEDNLNIEKRSIIIVFNTKTTMRGQLDVLKASFRNMISEMIKKTMSDESTNWVENYIIYGFVQTSNQMIIEATMVDTVDEAVNVLNLLQLNDGLSEQPVLTAIRDAQQTFLKMKSHAIVLVFADSPASDATQLSHNFIDNNPEQVVIQISHLWKSKLSFILSIPWPVDPKSDGVDVYHRLAMATHGDYYFVKTADETSQILNQIITNYYFPENIGIGYEATGSQVIVPTIDTDKDLVFLIVTIDPRTASRFPIVPDAGFLDSGTTYRLYYFLQNDIINITSLDNSMYNFRIFIQSKNTLLFSYTTDEMVDVGSGVVHTGHSMYSAVRTFGFSPMTNHSYHINSPSNNLLRDKYYAFQRPQLDCTFQSAFQPWVNTDKCVPGPITQVHTLYYDGHTKIRVSPGYCDQSAKNYIFEQEKRFQSYDVITPLISCDKKNIKAVNDPRLEPPKQFIFILEQHPNNFAIYQTLVKEIGDIIQFTKQNNNKNGDKYQNEYTLIIHCNQQSRVLISTYDPDVFIQKFPSFINSIVYVANLDSTLGLLSIVQAQKLNIRPTSQVYYFTNQAVKNVMNISRNWDIVTRDIEINFFTISDGTTKEIFALPQQLELVQKMSNGRIIPLGKNELSIKNIFNDMMGMNTLTTDNEKYDCHSAPFDVEAFVEDGSIPTNIQIVGTGIKDISISDRAGHSFGITNYVSYMNPNFVTLMIKDFMNPLSLNAGTWKISVSTSRGGCQVTVRQHSTIGVLLGFAGSMTSDFVESQIPSQRSDQNQSIYVPIQFIQPAIGAQIVVNMVTIENVNRKRYDLPTLFQNAEILKKDEPTCSYAFSTPRIAMPKSELSFWTVRGILNDGTALVRRFYYYQHFPSDPSICYGGKIDQYGQCICPPNYTGEYCWDRICVGGATPSYGICNCAPRAYGEFCEIGSTITNDTGSSTLQMSVSTTTIQSTTKISTKTNFIRDILIVLCIILKLI